MRFFLVHVLASLIMGCVPSATLDSFSDEKLISTFELIDARPEIQKETDRGNLWNPWDCFFEIKRIGDDQTEPERLIYLKHILSKEALELVAGKSIIVKDFVIYMNNQFASRKSPGEISRAQVAANDILSSQHCWQSEGSLGYYSEMENPDQNPVYIVQITIEKDGKEYRAQHVHPFKMWLSDFEANQYLFPAMEEAIAKLIEKIHAE